MKQATSIIEDPREREAELLERCLLIAGGFDITPRDATEAGLFGLASRLVALAAPEASDRLRRVSEAYFSEHPQDRLPDENLAKSRRIIGLSRFSANLKKMLGGAA